MVETRTVKAKKNIISTLMQNILNILLTFVSRIIFVRILDAGYLGINGLFSNVLNILSLADLGMGTAMMYRLYKPLAEDDIEKISALISFFRKIYLIIAMIIFLLGLAVIPFLDYIVKLDNPIPGLKVYYLIALLNVVISYLFVYRTTLLTADQKGYILNKYIMLFKCITFIAQTIVLIVFKNYYMYLLVALIISFLSNLFQNFIALKNYPFLKGKACNLDIKEKRQIGIDVKATFLYKISATIQGNTDNIMISIFVGTVFVGYYSNYLMIVTAVISIITLIFNSLKASIGNMIASDDTSLSKKYFLYNSFELINFWIVGFCSICFLCLFQDFIQLFFGNQYMLEFSVVIVMILNFYTNHIRQTIWAFRETTGLFYETRYITAVTAVINIFLSLILGYYFGMKGIIAATAIARMLYAWWKEPMILFKKFFKKSSKEYYIKYIKRIVLCAITYFVTIYMCNLIHTNNMYIEFICHIIMCLIIPNIIFLICYFRTLEFKYIVSKLIR